MRELNIGQCFNDGWAAMKKYMVPAIVGSLIIMVIEGVMGMIPILGLLASLILSGPFTGGLMWLFLNIIMDRNPQIGDVFKGFSRFPQFLGAFWLMFAISIACYLPAALISLIGLAISQEAFFVMLGILGLAAVVLAIVVMIRFQLVFFILADDYPDNGVIAAFKRSAP